MASDMKVGGGAPPTNVGQNQEPVDNTKFKSKEEVLEFVKTESYEAVSARNLLAGVTDQDVEGGTDQSRIDNSTWVKSFDENLKKELAKLGDTPSKEDVKKVVNNEYFKQYIFKGAIDKANGRIQERIKELGRDSFG